MIVRGAAAAAVILLPATAAAQIVQAQAGSSSLYDAHGASIVLRGRAVSVTVGAGRMGGSFTGGASVRAAIGSFVASAGDQTIAFDLPTDVFGGSYYVAFRGVGLERRGPRTRVLIMGGVTSEARGAPFFRGARAGDAAGLIVVERQLTAAVTAFSKNALGRSRTSISGLTWRPREGIDAALSAGVGHGQPYAAASTTLRRRAVLLAASFVHQQPGFRRVTMDSPLAAEPAKENVSLAVRPSTRWSVSLQRRRMVEDGGMTSAGAVALNQAGADVNVAGFRLTGAVYASSGLGRRHTGVSGSIGRRLSRSTDVVLDYYRSQPAAGPVSESYVARLHTTLSPRIGLLHVATYSAGQTSYNLGGEILSNPVRLSVTYNTVYAPLRAGDPFVQIVGVDGQVNLFDWMTLNLATYTTPSGRPRYTVSGSVIGGRANAGRGDRATPIRLPRYIVRGRVEDEAGAPVPGAVLRVGDEVISTNSEGRFFCRTNRRDALEIEVTPEAFLAHGRFQVVSAPAALTPRLASADTTESIIVVRRN